MHISYFKVDLNPFELQKNKNLEGVSQSIRVFNFLNFFLNENFALIMNSFLIKLLFIFMDTQISKIAIIDF